jgi:MFS transporter, DHA1 family, tetracycline resistance protein
VTIVVLPESHRSDPDEVHAALGDIRRALAAPRVSPILWQKLVFSLGLYGWFAVFALVLGQQFGFDQSSTSFFFCGFGVVSVVMQLAVVGRITDALGDRRSSLLGFAVMLLAFAIVPIAHDLWLAALMIVCFSFGLSMANATIPSLLTALAPDNLRGTVLGAASALDSVAGVAMPVITTYTLQAAGVAPTVAIPFGFVAAALAVGLIAMREPATQPS